MISYVLMAWLAAGVLQGSMPVTYTLLAECLPTKHRGIYLSVVHAFWVSASYRLTAGWDMLMAQLSMWIMRLEYLNFLISTALLRCCCAGGGRHAVRRHSVGGDAQPGFPLAPGTDGGARRTYLDLLLVRPRVALLAARQGQVRAAAAPVWV